MNKHDLEEAAEQIADRPSRRRADEVAEWSADVTRELVEMKKIGMRVPAKALAMARDVTVMAEYTNTGMKTSECADLLISLADMR